jgi:hypothetical protein
MSSIDLLLVITTIATAAAADDASATSSTTATYTYFVSISSSRYLTVPADGVPILVPSTAHPLQRWTVCMLLEGESFLIVHGGEGGPAEEGRTV